jgi:hypothetical protein
VSQVILASGSNANPQLAAAAESVLVSTNLVGGSRESVPVFIIGTYQGQLPNSTTALIFRVRRGIGLTGTVILTTNQISNGVVAAGIHLATILAVDILISADTVSYTLTGQAIGGNNTPNGTIATLAAIGLF